MNDQLTTFEGIAIAAIALLIGAIGTYFMNRWMEKPDCDCEEYEQQEPGPDEVCAWADCKMRPNLTVNYRKFCSWDHVPSIWKGMGQ